MWCGEQNKCPALCRGTTWKELLRGPYSSRQHKYLHFQILPHLGQCQRCTCVKNYFAYFPILLSLDQEVLLIYHSTVLFHALNPPTTKTFGIKRNLLFSSLLFCYNNLSLGMVGSGVGEGSVGIQKRTNISKVSSFTSFPPSLGIQMRVVGKYKFLVIR